MTKYGKTLKEKNGYKLVEIVKVDANGSITIIGYAILHPDGKEISKFSTYHDALDELERLTDDNTPPSPKPF